MNTTAGTLNAAGGITGGNITLLALSDVATGGITTLNSGFTGNSGNISVTSSNGIIDTRAGALITASGNGKGGDITLNAARNIYTRILNSVSTSGGTGGKIELNTVTGNITITTIIEPTQNTPPENIATNNNDIIFKSPSIFS
jgi:hypothetical protein